MYINFHSIISIYNILQLYSHETLARIEPTISEVKGATGPLKCYTRHGKNYRGGGAKQSRGGGGGSHLPLKKTKCKFVKDVIWTFMPA